MFSLEAKSGRELRLLILYGQLVTIIVLCMAPLESIIGRLRRVMRPTDNGGDKAHEGATGHACHS